MIQDIRDRHRGAKIAIVGSGITASKYIGFEDVSIALNKAIQLDRNWNYHMCFDTTLTQPGKAEFFFLKPEVQRILGFELAKDVNRERFIDPVITFEYTDRQMPVFDRNLAELSSIDNIAPCAIETAIIMGAEVIHLYGIDLNQGKNAKQHFDGTQGKGGYASRTAEFVAIQLMMCRIQGIRVGVCGSDNCQIDYVNFSGVN